jgi:hypothetical protein
MPLSGRCNSSGRYAALHFFFRGWATRPKPVIINVSSVQEIRSMSDPLSLVVNAEKAEDLASRTEIALQNNHHEAERLARQLVDIMQILHGPMHMEVGIAKFYLALALEEQGKVPEALEVRKLARKILLAQGIWRN